MWLLLLTGPRPHLAATRGAQVRTHLTKYFNKLVRDVNRLHNNKNKRAKTAETKPPARSASDDAAYFARHSGCCLMRGG